MIDAFLDLDRTGSRQDSPARYRFLENGYGEIRGRGG